MDHAALAASREALSPRSSEALCAGAFVALSVAVTIANGHFAYSGLVAVGVAVVFVARMARGMFVGHASTLRIAAQPRNDAAQPAWRPGRATEVASHDARMLAAVGVCLALGVEPPGLYLSSPLWAVPHWLLLSVELAAACLLFGGGDASRGRRKLALVTLVTAALTQKVLVLIASPAPTIDVFAMLQGGAEALLRGDNPYTALYPNPYAPGALLDGYVYPPLTVLATTPARLFFGDARVTLLACEILSFALLWRMEVGASPRGARSGWACLYLLRPRGTFVLEQSWTEPLSAALILGFFLAVRARRVLWAGLLAGLVLASKQYLVALAPLLALGLHRAASARLRRTLGAAALGLAMAALVTLPLALAAWDDFWHDVIRFHLDSPLRADALNLTALWLRLTGASVPAAISLAVGVAAVAVFAWLAWRARGAAWALAFGAAATLLFSLLLQKHAFCNYYDLVSALLAGCGALLVGDGEARAYSG